MQSRNRLSLMPRLGYALGFLASAGLIGFAFYLQYYEYQDPCPLCLLQRLVYIALMVLFLAAAAHGPGRAAAMVYGGLQCMTAAAGAAIATRHVWLQHLPPDQVPECGPSLEFTLQKYPLFQAFVKIFAGSGQCAEAGWKLLGLTIAGWSLAWFVLLGLFALYLAWQGARDRR
jgi:protein dithiol:quinone oxidoreductase